MPRYSPELDAIAKQLYKIGLSLPDLNVVEFFSILKRKKFWGELTLKMENGSPVNIKRMTENIKVSEIADYIK